MIEWIRWALLLGGLAFAAWWIHQDGYKAGRNDLLIEVQKQAIADRDSTNAELVEQLESGKAQAEQERVDLAALQSSIEQISARTGSIGSQLRNALNASNLATCVLPVDVQRVRADAYEQARAAAAAANQARAGG